jgi:hypothetical protein
MQTPTNVAAATTGPVTDLMVLFIFIPDFTNWPELSKITTLCGLVGDGCDVHHITFDSRHPVGTQPFAHALVQRLAPAFARTSSTPK